MWALNILLLKNQKLKNAITTVDQTNRLSVVLLGKKSDFTVYKFGDDGRLLANSKLPSIKKKSHEESTEEWV